MEKTNETLSHSKFVALIRGINVGRAKRVPMAELREMISDLSYTDVRSFLNSGNLVFIDRSSDPVVATSRIEQGIASRFGISARVTVLSASELDSAVNENPLLGVADNPSRLFVAFLLDSDKRGTLEPLLEQDWAPEILALGPRVAYVWCPNGLLQSPLSDAIARLVGDSATTRNWRTTMRIHAAIHDPRE